MTAFYRAKLQDRQVYFSKKSSAMLAAQAESKKGGETVVSYIYAQAYGAKRIIYVDFLNQDHAKYFLIDREIAKFSDGQLVWKDHE